MNDNIIKKGIENMFRFKTKFTMVKPSFLFFLIVVMVFLSGCSNETVKENNSSKDVSSSTPSGGSMELKTSTCSSINGSLNDNAVKDNVTPELNIDFADFSLTESQTIARSGQPGKVVTGTSCKRLYYGENYITFTGKNVKTINDFFLVNGSVMPIGIKIGETIVQVYKKILTPEQISKKYDLPNNFNDNQLLNALKSTELSLFNIDERGDYYYRLYVDENFCISKFQILKYEHPILEVKDLPRSKDVPTFDKIEAFAVNELVIRNNEYVVGIGSNANEIVKFFGNPNKTYKSYGDDWIEAYDIYDTIFYYDDSEVHFPMISDPDNLSEYFALEIRTGRKGMIGPRGIAIGDSIEKILNVVPTNNGAIDFSKVNDYQLIYPANEDYDEYGSYAKVIFGSSPQCGVVVIRIMDGDMGSYIYFDYFDGIISEITIGSYWDL